MLEAATRAAINAHYALLPRYAGLSPYFWYLRNREVECGATLHQMVSKLDAGNMPLTDLFTADGLEAAARSAACNEGMRVRRGAARRH